METGETLTGLVLVKPCEPYGEEVMAFRDEMLREGRDLPGCAKLECVETFAQWLDFEGRLKAEYKDGYVPSKVYLAVTPGNGRVVGIIDFRHPLSEFLLKFGGNIGYSVRPSERRKGYGGEMLGLMLEKCREFGEERVLVVCDKRNEASRRTILKNHGVLENEVEDTAGISKSGVIQRYWIEL